MRIFILTTLVIFVCAACSTLSIDERWETARQIAARGNLAEHVLVAGPFNLTSFQRITSPAEIADVYIEGDGLAWVSKQVKSMNPTPVHPIALGLAAQDPSAAVIYLARPCQYSGWNGQGACPDKYWSEARTASEVIHAYGDVLDRLKKEHGFTGFHLIGYSGGAAVALLVAAQREDVLSVRTVAGNLDYKAFAQIHGTTVTPESLDPAESAPKLAMLPQYHFIGGRDTIVPPVIYENWKQKSVHSYCLSALVMDTNTHQDGWIEQWPQLLAKPVVCH